MRGTVTARRGTARRGRACPDGPARRFVRVPALAGALAAMVTWLAMAGAALADSPAPSGAVSGDPRAGQAAGFVGNPALAVLIVGLIIVASVAVTLAWIRATGGRSATDDRGG